MDIDDDDDIWPTKAQRARAAAQARQLRAQAGEGGLRFEAYLPSSLAEWLLEQVERGVYLDPSEAMFVIVKEFVELHLHADLRQEILRRGIQKALDDKRPGIPAEEVFAELRERFSKPQPAPAQWQREPAPDSAASLEAVPPA